MKIKARILVVDDNCDLSDSIKEILEERDYFVEYAANGKEAIELARNKYNIALIDVKLPDIPGNEVVEKIAEISPSTDFIYMTGNATINSAIEAVKQKRVVSYEIKPLDLNHLLALINQVTERKKAEEELHQYERIISSSTDMLAFMDKKFIYVAVNPAYLEAFKKTREELIGYTASEVFGEEFFNTVIKPHAERCLAGKEVNYQVWMEFPAYGKKYMEVAYYPYTNADNEIVGFIVNGRDITERKRAEEEIRNLAKFPSENPNPVLRVEKNGAIIFANNAGMILLDYWGTQTGQSVPEDWHKHALDVLRSGKSKDYEMKCNDRIFSLTLAPVVEKGYVNFYGLDITGHKKADERIRKLSSAVVNSPTTVIITDNKGNIEYANPKFTQISGYSIEEAIGKNVRILQSGKTPQEVYKKLWETITSGNEWGGEFCNRKKNGELYWELASISPIKNEKGVITNFVAVKEDITKRKQMEEELKSLNETLEQRVSERTAELAKANEELLKMQKLESIGILAGGIAHDFNNNLQGILNLITMARTYANPKDEIYGRLTEAEKVVLQARNLTQQLLTFSEGGDPVKKTISISELIINCAKLALSGSNVKYEFGISNSLWQVEADQGQITQAINNIIINADQAMPEGGNIKIWAENTNVVKKDSLPLKEGRYVKIGTKDQGTGISQEHLQKIFDPYFTNKQKGSGLGLAITYSIIKKHGGHITVESEIGVGATFYIYLPVSRKEAIEKPVLNKVREKDVEEVPITGQGYVLLMEDERILRNSIVEHLRRLRYEVESAEDGLEAIELYKGVMESGKPFDVVILDLTIPGGMGGEETIKKLLKIDPDVKVIVSSGFYNDPVMSNFREYGFKDAIAKPHKVYELHEALQKVIKGENE